jgi:hypothetical protein
MLGAYEKLAQLNAELENDMHRLEQLHANRRHLFQTLPAVAGLCGTLLFAILSLALPCILRELNHLVDEWFQHLVQFDCLFAQLHEIVRLGEQLIVPYEEPLQRLDLQIATILKERSLWPNPARRFTALKKMQEYRTPETRLLP